MSNDPDLDPDLGLDLRNVISSLVTIKEVKKKLDEIKIASPCISTAQPGWACPSSCHLIILKLLVPIG